MKILLILLGLSLISSSVVKIDVLFESLCPYCKDLIKRSFNEFLDFPDHDKLAVINWVPFGNAYDHWDEAKQEWVTECQHGPQECVGNLVEVCARKKLDLASYYNFLVCFENNFTAKDNAYKAAKKCSPDQGDAINYCAQGKEGNILLHEASLETPDSIEYNPWIVVNGEHDTDAESDITDSLVDYLCKDRKDIPSCVKHMDMKSLKALAILS